MGFRDRLTAATDRAREMAGDAADSALGEKLKDTFDGLKGLIEADEERGFSPERYLLEMVTAVRRDDEEDLTDKDVEKAAKRRWRKARRTALLAGPLIGMANQAVDLYCETATFHDLNRLHGLRLSDEQVAAHMLVLWDATPDLATATAAIDGTGPTVTTLIGTRFAEQASESMPDMTTKLGFIKGLWKARGLAGDVREKTLGTSGSITGVVFTGKRVKGFIKRAEAQLGVADD